NTTTLGSITQYLGVVTANIGAIGSNQTATITMTVKPTLAGTYTNTASISSEGLDLVSANNTVSAVTTVNPLADLTITKTAPPNQVIVTSNCTYTVTVTNRGPTAAPNVVVSDPWPA